MSTLVDLKEKFDSVWPLLDERTRRIMAASEAKALGYVEEMKHINIKRNRFHGEWNYMIKPKAKKA